ncbi:hypothetical protein [Azospirillum sp. TSO5]|uniref:hypothetical protein n=1 Tax=Azospirillum sp. TSO5 TaxID=716760 RepID=UPI000D61D869|nr:hypothetical protein [Azospirillum sp. TSO5]PWC97714.1 hypothetical protein TSO5_04215 [Azospirillum sp. TSO5]
MSNLQQELLITITGRVPLPSGLFEQARVIASVEDKIIALRQTAGSVDGIDFQVDAQVVAAGAEPEQPEAGQPETAEQAATRRKRRTKAEMEAARAAEAAQQQGAEPPATPTGEQQIDLEEAIAAQGVPTGAIVVTGQSDVMVQDIPLTQPAPAPQPVAQQPVPSAAPAKAPPPWAKKSEPAPAQDAPPAAAPEPAAQQPVGAGRIPVLKADGTVFSSYASIENAEAKMIELINACTTEPELDALMGVNEQVCEWPMAIRERVYSAAQDRETALVAAAKAGA